MQKIIVGETSLDDARAFIATADREAVAEAVARGQWDAELGGWIQYEDGARAGTFHSGHGPAGGGKDYRRAAEIVRQARANQ